MGSVAGEAGGVTHVMGGVMQRGCLHVTCQRDDAKAQNHCENRWN
jgi:hypothetical protein